VRETFHIIEYITPNRILDSNSLLEFNKEMVELYKNPIIQGKCKECDLFSYSMGIELNPLPMGLYHFLLLVWVVCIRVLKHKSVIPEKNIIENALNYDIFGFLRDNLLNNIRFHDDVYNIENHLELLSVFVKNFIMSCSEEV
jgi:hypothetical protein